MRSGTVMPGRFIFREPSKHFAEWSETVGVWPARESAL